MAKGNNKEKEAIKTYKDSVRQAESGGNNKAKNSRSSARGLFQFTDATWKEMEKKIGKSLNIDSEADQELAMDKLTSMNAEALTKNGLPVTASNLYMTHVLGVSGGPKFLKNLKENPNELATKYVSAAAAKANPDIFYRDGKPTSASDVFNKLTEKVKQSVGSGITGGITGLEEGDQFMQSNDPSGLQSQSEEMELDPSGLVPQEDPQSQPRQQLAQVEKIPEDQFSFGNVDKKRVGLGMSGDLNFLSSTAGLAFQEDDRLEQELDGQEVNMAKNGGNLSINQHEHGGQMSLSNGELNEFNEGGKHEENMFGGIPQGMGANGKLNTVEEGETKFNGYVFSDTLKVNQSDIDSLYLPKELNDKTFAEASKYINDVLKDNPNDNIIKKTVKKQLDSLTLGNEKARLAKEQMDLNMEEDYESFPEMEAPLDVTSNQMFLGGDEDEEQSIEDYYQSIGKGAGALKSLASGDNQGAATGLLSAGLGAAGTAFGGPIGGLVGSTIGEMAGGLISKGSQRREEQDLYKKELMTLGSKYNNDFDNGGYMEDDEYGDLINKKGYKRPLELDLGLGMNDNFDVQNAPEGYKVNYPQGPIVDGNAYSDLVQGAYPRTDNSKVKSKFTGTDYSDKSKGTSALQYAPVLGNALNYMDAKKDKAEVTSLDRLDKRYNPNYVDEMTLQNSIGNDFDNTVNSLSGATNGSQGSLRANILGAGLNRSKSMSDAYIKADEINRGQDQIGQQFNMQVDSANMGQSNNEKDINSKARAANEDAKMIARNRLFDSIGGVGKEETFDNRLQNMTGYNSSGQYVQGDEGLMTRLKELLSRSNSKESGGMVTNISSGSEPGSLQEMLENEIRKKYK